jgi:hypothetical protein
VKVENGIKSHIQALMKNRDIPKSPFSVMEIPP